MPQDENYFDTNLYLDPYVKYIRNTGRVPLTVEKFDYDWEPIGPLVRRDMLAARLITVDPDGIRIVTP